MAASGLDYSIRKKLDTQHLRDITQLVDRVRQVERLKAEKARTSKYHKKEKVAYVETNDSDQEFDIAYSMWKLISESRFSEKMKVAYSMAEEELIDFPHRCKLNNYEVMMSRRCSSVFDMNSTKGLEISKPQSKKKGKWYPDHRPKFTLTIVLFLSQTLLS